MRPIYKSLALAAMALRVSLALHAETRDDESASTMALQANLLDSLRVELVALNVSGARNLIESGECVIDGSNLTITLDTSEWTRGAMYRVQVLATFGTNTQVIYALNITVPYYVALSAGPQEFEDNVTIVSTITDVTEADLEGLALEKTSQEIKATITPISQAAEAYSVGKTQLAAAITSKGVETSPTESYPEMADKVTQIVQTQQVIDGGDMYAKQLFGSLTTPNYWNLYEVMAQLLSDGRLVNYGGILLAEYYKGYDSLALSGAGAGGAYVVSDKDIDGNFIMYTNDTTHTWDTEDDGKGNRWVAYCFADAGHDFEITDTNTSPRRIHIGRSVGTIRLLAESRCAEIVVSDGNTLGNIQSEGYISALGQMICIRNVINQSGSMFYIPTNGILNAEKAYIQIDTISGYLFRCPHFSGKFNMYSMIIDCKIWGASGRVCAGGSMANLVFLQVNNSEIGIINLSPYGDGNYNKLKRLNVTNCDCEGIYYDPVDANNRLPSDCVIYVGYKTEDKSKIFEFKRQNINGWLNVQDIQLQDGWCRGLIANYCTGLTEANMYAHILQRLKQDEPDCGDGVTITLGATNLAKLTSQESVDLLDDLTNIYGYTFA